MVIRKKIAAVILRMLVTLGRYYWVNEKRLIAGHALKIDVEQETLVFRRIAAAR